jgi:hypothetical protein
MIWAFVDYENTGSLEGVNVSDYDKVFIFCGPKNQKIKFGTLPTNGFTSIEVIGVSTMGPNNLDFIIAFHLGRLHEIADQDTEFHLVSNDGGFNGLVNHLKKIGRKCKKVLTKPNTTPRAKPKAKPKTNKPVLSECASIVVDQLKILDGRKRPRKKAKLLNWIKSHCNSIKGFSGPDVVYRELIASQLVSEEGSALRYKLKK